MVNERKCRLDANRELSPWKMTRSTSLIPSKWTSCWLTKESNVFIPYSEVAPIVLGVYYQRFAYQYLLALISRWNQNLRLTAGLTFSAFHNWSIEQGDSVPNFLGKQDACKWLRTKYNYQRKDCFFPWEFDRLCCWKASERESKQNRIFLQCN